VTSRPFTRAASTRLRVREARAQAAVFLFPAFAFIAVFSYYPAFRALTGAFTAWDGFNPPTWVGFANFVAAFHDPTFLASIQHMLLWTMVGIPLALVPAFIVAELIFHLRSAGAQHVYRFVFVMAMVIPSVVYILIWQYIFNPLGLLNAALQAIGLGAWLHPWLALPQYALWAMILMGFPWVSPFNLLVLYAGLQAVPSDVWDAAAVDGAHGVKRIVAVDIPLVLSQVKLLLILAIVGVSQNLLTPLLLTDGGPGSATTTPVFYMYQVSIGYDQYGYGMAIAVMLFLLVMTLALVNMRYFRSGEPGV
jgi:raffinose/stachyose/melibiose transport system permease protein